MAKKFSDLEMDEVEVEGDVDSDEGEHTEEEVSAIFDDIFGLLDYLEECGVDESSSAQLRKVKQTAESLMSQAGTVDSEDEEPLAEALSNATRAPKERASTGFKESSGKVSKVDDEEMFYGKKRR